MEERRFVLTVTLVLAAAFLASNFQSGDDISGMAGTFVRTPSNIQDGIYVQGNLEPIKSTTDSTCGNNVVEIGEQCDPPGWMSGSSSTQGIARYCNSLCEIEVVFFPPGSPPPEPHTCGCSKTSTETIRGTKMTGNLLVDTCPKFTTIKDCNELNVISSCRYQSSRSRVDWWEERCKNI